MSRTSGNEVEDFLQSLDHPQRDAFAALRQTILGIDPAVTEGIKWNAPSFRIGDDFATFHTRKPQAMVILHFGAKGKPSPGWGVEDPERLLEWLGPDRAAAKFASVEDVAARRLPFEAVLREWIREAQSAR